MSRPARWLWCLLFGAGCAHEPRPEDALAEYRAALGRHDAATVIRLSAATSTQSAEIEAIERSFATAPEAVDRLIQGLGGPVVEKSVVLRLQGGRQIALVQRPDGYKVLDTALSSLLSDTPTGRVAAFFAAFHRRDSEAILALIPKADRAKYADRVLLWAQLDGLAKRIARAEESLGDLSTHAAEILGETALIRYDATAAVRLVLEDGAWRIADID
ncbi:MAG: hypothetical protein U1E65_35940 [Myxococcota bacterium]